jgi:ABC-2 type transport system permease protein
MAYLRLIWVFFRLGALNELEYRANFVVQLFQSLLGLGAGLSGLAIIFAHTGTLGGWRPAELLALLGVYLLVGGAINLMIRPSFTRLIDDVRQGTLDFTLTRPEDAQLLVSIRQVQIWQLGDVALGLIVLALALARLGAAIDGRRALMFAASLLAGGAIAYSFLLILATCSFWLVRVENLLSIFQSLYEAGRWPVGIYPRWLRWTLTFLVPVAFAISVPAEALAGRLNSQTLLGAVTLAAVLLAGSRWFWGVGLRRYSGASA